MKNDPRHVPGIMNPIPLVRVYVSSEASEALKRSGYYPGDEAFVEAAASFARLSYGDMPGAWEGPKGYFDSEKAVNYKEHS